MEAWPACAGLSRRLTGLGGWRRRGLAVLLGALAATALPPLHAVPLLVPAFAGWLWLIVASPGVGAAFAIGWWFGLGHFAVGLYWIAHALLVEPETYGWLIPFAIGGIAAGMALFPAAAAALVRALKGRGPGAVLLLAAAWTLGEWVRSWLFTGFPWNLTGTVWAAWPPMLQSAAVIGTYGLGLITVVLAALPAVAGDDALAPRRRLALLAAGGAALALLWVGGEARLAGAGPAAMVEGVRLRLVQPDIPQQLKWVPELRDRHLVRQVEMSRRGPGNGAPAVPPTHVIWAETAVPFFLANDPQRRAFLARAVPEGGLLIVGAPRTTAAPQPQFEVWNSLEALDGTGRIVGTYDKVHLVPFGEYVPLRGLIPFKKLTAGRTDFSAGRGLETLSLPGLPPVSPLICYEVIFPGAVASRDARPQWLLNLTNDGWFGLSSGPYQHLAAARMRTVEEGLPLVRAANGGISVVIDAHGRTVARLGLGETGVLDAPLPVALAVPPPYARFGGLLVLALAGGAAAAGWWGSRRRPA
ncbi:apolipoprotein N-acyltransferase [Shumkonia mesophila]|uniref:apolipoprotein N-acyltransferase n=1 Tax=Shumkonia mesophila TaxID=2838854 RepID=UPI0029344F61|nr:apolipoprotein N-acyltransferase [Shumkonia mesophila]